MSYPHVEGKYAHEAVYSPVDSKNYRDRINSESVGSSPEGIVLSHQPGYVARILSLENGLRNQYVTEGLYPLSSKEDKVGIYLCGLGASHAAVIMEELIARGSKRFLNIGVAGSLQEDFNAGDIVVCQRAIRDEGVSHHYIKPGKYIDLSNSLTERLKEALAVHGLSFRLGTTWTTDAPFRETREEIVQYQSEGVVCVEMETAALAAVAQHRGVEFAAAFVISDSLLGGVWNPRYHAKEVAVALEKLHEAFLLVF